MILSVLVEGALRFVQFALSSAGVSSWATLDLWSWYEVTRAPPSSPGGTQVSSTASPSISTSRNGKIGGTGGLVTWTLFEPALATLALWVGLLNRAAAVMR